MLSNVLKLTFERPRPDLVAHATQVFTSSFPSGHATLSAVTFLTLGALLASLHTSRRLKMFFLGLAIVLTVAVGFTRIFSGCITRRTYWRDGAWAPARPRSAGRFSIGCNSAAPSSRRLMTC